MHMHQMKCVMSSLLKMELEHAIVTTIVQRIAVMMLDNFLDKVGKSSITHSIILQCCCHTTACVVVMCVSSNIPHYSVIVMCVSSNTPHYSVVVMCVSSNTPHYSVVVMCVSSNTPHYSVLCYSSKFFW